MVEYYQIRNWERFQHYRRRCPPWIKLHWELLTSREWVMLNDGQRLLAIVCMLVASRSNGHVPNDPSFLKRVAYLDQDPDLTPLLEIGFLIPLQAESSCKQSQANGPPETEKETETETHAEKREPENMRAQEIQANEEWDMADYVHHFQALCPEYKRIAESSIVNALKVESDPGHRARAYNDCVADLLGTTETVKQPVRVLTGFMRNARRFSENRKQTQETGESYADLAKEFEDKEESK